MLRWLSCLWNGHKPIQVGFYVKCAHCQRVLFDGYR